MTTTNAPSPPTQDAPAAPHRRRWLRWLLIISGSVLVLLAAAVIAAVKLQSVPAPLALPASVALPAGALDGTYQVTSGSQAGFRIQQTVLGMTSEVVGRTSDVTGAATIVNGQVTVATLRVNLLALTADNGKPAPQFGISLETQRYPDATIALVQPLSLSEPIPSGGSATLNATGTLTLHGFTRTETVPLTIRRDGTSIDVAGAVPVQFADYGITGPRGYGPFGSLADHGVAEFLLMLRPGVR